MRKLDLGQTISILANLGVIAGIMFLAVELRQNNQLLRADAIDSLFERRISRNEEIARNESLAAVIAKNQRKEELTHEERIRISANDNAGYLHILRTYLLFQEGVITEDLLESQYPQWKIAYSPNNDSVGYTNYDRWETWKRNAPPEFISFFEGCVIADCESVPR